MKIKADIQEIRQTATTTKPNEYQMCCEIIGTEQECKKAMAGIVDIYNKDNKYVS